MPAAVAHRPASSPTPVSEPLARLLRPRRCGRLSGLGAALALLCWAPRVVLADTPPSAPPSADTDQRARALFQQGVAAAASARFEEAARAFGESDALRSAPATRYNLAAALFELERFAEAYDALASVSWPASTPSDTRSRADGLLRRLEQHVAHLRVQLAGEAAGVGVLVDGTPLPPSEFGKARTLTPGDHALQVTRDAAPLSSRALSLAPRALTAVELVVLPPAVTGVAPAAPPTPAPASSEPASQIWRRWELWTAIGAAIVVGGVAGWAITSATHDDTPARSTDGSARFAF